MPIELFGTTRTVLAARHALIAPDGHVPGAFPGSPGAIPFVMISPAMGADFSQILMTFAAGGGFGGKETQGNGWAAVCALAAVKPGSRLGSSLTGTSA